LVVENTVPFIRVIKY